MDEKVLLVTETLSNRTSLLKFKQKNQEQLQNCQEDKIKSRNSNRWS